MQAYDDYNHGKLLPYDYPQEKVRKAVAKIRELYPWLETLPY